MVAYPVTRHLMAQTRQLRPISARINSVRALSYTPTSIRLAQKDAQHKDSLNPRSTEYSKSGSDDDAARVQETAFDSDKTSPEEQMNHAEGEASKVRVSILTSLRFSSWVTHASINHIAQQRSPLFQNIQD